MGYNIHIGNAELDPDVDEYDTQYRVTVAAMSHAEAPCAPGDTNPGQNIRWPSYAAWADFARFVGLYELLLDRKSDEPALMAEHPGCAVLRKRHVERIELALKHLKDAFPDAVASFQSERERDYQLARLEWLAWWSRWAIEHCKLPAIYNS